MHAGPRVPKLLILAALIAIATPLPACLNNVANDSLWHGIHTAELILVAKLVEVEVDEIALAIDLASARAQLLAARAGLDLSLPRLDPSAAFTLEAAETLLGDPVRHLTFRLPGAYAQQTSALEVEAIYFLHREAGAWQLSRRPIFLQQAEDLPELRTAIHDALALGPSASDASVLDWHVEAAAHAGTRAYVAWNLEELVREDPLPYADGVR